MRKLHRDDAVGPQENRDSRHEVVQIRNVSEQVVARHQIGGAALFPELLGRVDAEEAVHGVDADLPCRFGDVGRGFDTQAGNAELLEVSQQVAVIAREFDYEAILVETEARPHGLAILSRMRQPALRVGRKVGVLAEDRIRRDEFAELHEPAVLANERMERIERLHLVHLLRLDVRLAQRRDSEVGEGRR